MTVSGSGFEPFAEVDVTQCRNGGGCAGRATVEADGSGGFSELVFVSYSSVGFFSCEDPYCEVYASVFEAGTISNRVPISFAGSTSTSSLPSPGPGGTIPFDSQVTNTGIVTGNSTGGSPTGSMSFFVCGPAAAGNCEPFQGGSAVPGNPRPLVAGPNHTASATSGSFTPPAPGRYCFRTVYSGSAVYGASFDGGQNGCFFSKIPATVSMRVSSPWVPLLHSFVPSAEVTGIPVGGSPTGTVALYYCEVAAPATCESGGSFSSTTTLIPGPNNTSERDFGGWSSNAPRRFCFRAEYRGDSRYFASSGAGPAACVVVGGYPRPKAANSVHVPLVPAFGQCTAPNASHGPPLASGSCTPPALHSGHLTVGTPDANSRASKSVGYLRLRTIMDEQTTNPDESDVAVTVSLSDVRNRGDLSDYTGELDAGTVLRLTDHFTPVPPYGNGPATAEDFRFAVTVPCAATSDTSIGANCSVSTTAEAVIPGAVAKNGRTIWQTGPVRVHDGGADGDTDTAADNTLFATQGVFIP